MSLLQKELDVLKDLLHNQRLHILWAISKAIAAMEEHDQDKAQEVIDSDVKVDELEVKIEEECLRILVLHQPVATDMRYVVAIFKINTSLERIGDYAANIAKRSVSILISNRPDFSFNLSEMAYLAKQQVKNSLDAFFNQDSDLAYKVCTDDKKVDAFRKYFTETIIKDIQEFPDQAENLFDLSSLVRHFERMADMATHIAEETIYLVKGKITRHVL